MTTEQVVSQINFNTLVVTTTVQGQTTVDIVPSQTSVVSNSQSGIPIVVTGPTLPVGTGKPSSVPLVLSPFTNVQTSVDTVAAPVSTVQKLQGAQSIVVNTGSPGPVGPAGSGGGNVFIQSSAPVSPPAQYLWIETDFPSVGNQTVWVNY